MCKKNPEKQNLVEKLSGNNSEKALKRPTQREKKRKKKRKKKKKKRATKCPKRLEPV